MRAYNESWRHWTDADEKLLREFHAENCPIRTIAAAMGRTVESIRHRKKKLRLGRCLKMDAHNMFRRYYAQKRKEAQRCTA